MTHFVTEPVDQSALVGIINRLNSLGLPLLAMELLSVEWVWRNQPAAPVVENHKPPLSQSGDL